MSPDARGLVAAVVGTGALVGLGAAVVWHVATPSHVASNVEFGWYAYTPVRPSWFPSSLLLVGAGALIALILASFLVDSGLRIRSARERQRTGLFVLLLVLGGSLGFGTAAAWEHWPPQPPAPEAELVPGDGFYVSTGGIATSSTTVVGYAALTSVMTAEADSYYAWDDTSVFDPVVEHPWILFPLGGAVLAGAVALSLSVRDYRLVRHDSE